MEKRSGCDRGGVAIPVQLRQRFKPCCPVFAVLKDCADCSGCSPLRGVVVVGGRDDDLLEENYTCMRWRLARAADALVRMKT